MIDSRGYNLYFSQCVAKSHYLSVRNIDCSFACLSHMIQVLGHFSAEKILFRDEVTAKYEAKTNSECMGESKIATSFQRLFAKVLFSCRLRFYFEDQCISFYCWN